MTRPAPARPGRSVARNLTRLTLTLLRLTHERLPRPNPVRRTTTVRALVPVVLVTLTGSLAAGLAGCSGSPATPGGTSGADRSAGTPASPVSSSPAPGAAAGPARTVSVIPGPGGGVPSAGSSSEAAAAATDVVSRFYGAYLARPGRATASNFVDRPLLDVLFAPHAAFDRVMCSNTLPDSIAVAPATGGGETATVQVAPTHQGAARPPIEVTVRTSDLRITRIDCAD